MPRQDTVDPARGLLVTPGWVGSASTKWLHTLTVLDAPFKGTYMDGSKLQPAEEQIKKLRVAAN